MYASLNNMVCFCLFLKYKYKWKFIVFFFLLLFDIFFVRFIYDNIVVCSFSLLYSVPLYEYTRIYLFSC